MKSHDKFMYTKPENTNSNALLTFKLLRQDVNKFIVFK